MGKNKIEVESFGQYRKTLEENGVILASEDRSDRIQHQLHDHSVKANSTLREDKELLAIMANEVEYPEVLTGTFPVQIPEVAARNFDQCHAQTSKILLRYRCCR